MIEFASYSSARNLTPAREPSAKPSGMDALQAVIDRQNLVIQALIVLLLDKKVMSEEEIRATLARLDELDGRRDGRLAEDKRPIVCPQCQRKNSPSAVRCAYCSAPFGMDVVDPRLESREDS